MTDLNIREYKSKIIEEITNFANTAGVESYEITDEFKRYYDSDPQNYSTFKDLISWRDFIYEKDDVAAIDKIKEPLFKIINNLAKEKQEKKVEKLEKDRKLDTEHERQMKEYWQGQTEWWRKFNNKEHDWQKSNVKKEEENNRRLDNYNKNPDDWRKKLNDKTKNDMISDIEFDLKKKKISEERLNQRLNVSDWREEIRKCSDSTQAIYRRSGLWDTIRELTREYVCAKCGNPDDSYFPYKKGSKKYCSYECRYNEDNGKVNKTDIGEIVKAFQNWMKKMKIEKVSYSSNGELVIKFEGKTEKAVKDSELSSEQKEIKSFLQKSASTKEITASSEFKNNPSSPNKKGNDNTGLILGGLVIVGIIAIIIAVIVNKNKKREKY